MDFQGKSITNFDFISSVSAFKIQTLVLIQDFGEQHNERLLSIMNIYKDIHF